MASEQSQSTRVLELLAWIEVHKKKLIIGASVLVVVGFGIYVHLLKQRERESAAARALTEKRPPAGASDITPRMRSDDYLAVVKQYAGTGAAEQALLLAARSLFAEGKYAEAQALFEKFVAEHKGSPWIAQAEYGIAACLDARNETKQALAKYQQVAARYSSEAVVPYAQLAAARLCEASGRSELALRIYDEMARAKLPTMLNAEVRLRREALLQKFPQLAATSPSTTVAITNRPGPSMAATNAPAAKAGP
jgi:TolA-binding protein